MAVLNCLFKKKQNKGRMCFMAQSNQFIWVIVERVNNHMLESIHTYVVPRQGALFCFGTVPFFLQHPALLKS